MVSQDQISQGVGGTLPAAIIRFKDKLTASGMDADSVGFLLGRLFRLIEEEVLVRLVQIIGKDEFAKYAEVADEVEKIGKFEQAYREKSGRTIRELRDEVAETIVQNFESQG